MCVINVIENNNYPSKDMIDKMSKENPHGNSIIYFDKTIDKIVYKKAIELRQLYKILDYCKKNNFKTILHFRIASVNTSQGNIGKMLCHPFEITNNDQTILYNKTNNDVLIHNGTLDMDRLNDMALQIMLNNPKAKYPKSELSDTKLLSWILSHVDYSILNMFTDGNKFTVMNGLNGNITKYGNWHEVKDDKNTLICSNEYFNTDLSEYSWFNSEYANYGINDVSFLNKDEKKEAKRLIDEFDITEDILNQYLDMGYSVYDLESILTNELKYIQQYDDYEAKY